MKKRLLLILLLMPSLVLGQKLHDGWHNSGDEFTVSGDQYYIYHNYGDENVLISVNNASIILQVGKCALKGDKEICLTGLDQSLSSDRVEYSNGIVLAAAQISVNSMKPKLGITRTFGKTSLNLDEQTTVSVTLSNDGNVHINKFVYEDSFPDGVEILEANPGENKFTRTGNLKPGQSMKFSYTLEMKGENDFNSQAIVNYTYNGVTSTSKSSSNTIYFKSPYDIDIDLSDNALSLGESTFYDVRIENDDDGELRVKNMNLIMPNMPYTLDREFNETKNGYFWRGFLDPDEALDYRIKFTPEKTGDYDIILEIVLEDADEKTHIIKDTQTIQVGVSEVRVSLLLIPDIGVEGSDVRLRAVVENTGNIQIEVTEASLSFLDEKLESVREAISPGEDEVIFNEVMNVPKGSTGKLPIVFEGEYKTLGGEDFDFYKKASFKVKVSEEEPIVIEVEEVPEIVEEVVEEVVEEPEVVEEVVEEPEEGGIVVKILRKFTGFFSWLLSDS